MCLASVCSAGFSPLTFIFEAAQRKLSGECVANSLANTGRLAPFRFNLKTKAFAAAAPDRMSTEVDTTEQINRPLRKCALARVWWQLNSLANVCFQNAEGLLMSLQSH